MYVLFRETLILHWPSTIRMCSEHNLVHTFIAVDIAVELVRKAGYEVSGLCVGLLAWAINLNLLVMD